MGKFKGVSIFSLFFLFMIFGSGILPASPKKNTGEIHGTVSDNENHHLIAANILLPCLERGTSSNDSGRFVMANIPEGTYHILVQYLGYKSQTKTVKVISGDMTEINFSLSESALGTAGVTITGTPTATNKLSTPQEVYSLSGQDKRQSEAASIGETLEQLPGVSNLSAGGVAGKPLIRGHTGERIRVLNDGISQEYQQYGERHGPNAEAFNFERIEVIKGAASLLYGSDALGGAVNLIPPPLPSALYQSPFLRGDITTRFQSVNQETMTGIRFDGARHRIGYRGSFTWRNAGNFTTPDEPTFAESNLRGDPKFTGEIDYTDFEQFSGSAGVGYLSDHGSYTIHYDRWFNSNNFLLPSGDPLGLQLTHQNATLKGVLIYRGLIFKPKISYQRNHRKATKAGLTRSMLPDSANVNLVLNVYSARFDVEHVSAEALSGTIGGEIRYYDHENIGLVPLQPTGNFTNLALYVFEEATLGQFIFNLGARIDHRTQKFLAAQQNPLLPQDDERNYTSIAAAAGSAYRLSDHLTITLNATRGFRTPSFFNLYVFGNHGGVFAFQIGNPELKSESSLDLNTGIRYQTNRVEASASIFNNTINDYIFLFSDPDNPLAPSSATFVFAHDQADARIYGAEATLKVSPLKWLQFSSELSWIDSKFLSGPHKDKDLPLMPPLNGIAKIKFFFPHRSVLKNTYGAFSISYKHDRDAAGEYEPFGQFDDGIGPDIPFGIASTKNYSLLNLAAGGMLNMGNYHFYVDVEINNLLNEGYRDFLDTYKGYTLGPGRNLRLNLTIPFGR